MNSVSHPVIMHECMNAFTDLGVTSSQLPSRQRFLIMSSRVMASSAVGGGATRVARSTSTVASSRLEHNNTTIQPQDEHSVDVEIQGATDYWVFSIYLVFTW